MIILYDGECGLCARVVQFTLARDKMDRFRYAALQSPFAAEILERHGRATSGFDTFVLVRDHGTAEERLEERSRAGISVLEALPGLWRAAAVLRIFPRFLGDLVYNLVAKNRLRWFGRVDQCLIPAPRVRAKFLDAGGGG